MIRIALFAARSVGLEVARFLGKTGRHPACLILDVEEDAEQQRALIRATGLPPGKVFTSDTLYSAETLRRFRLMDLDLGVLAWWPYILKQPVIDLPKLGCLNFHPSYLPHNRGKNYNFWSIVEGTPFGVTLHFIDRGIDTGDVAYQRRIPTSWEDTGQTLYDKAQREIVQLFKDKFSDIERGSIPRRPQDLSKGSYHAARELHQASQIHLGRRYTARQMLNLMRARTFPPHPGVWFLDRGRKYEVRMDIRRISD